MLLLGHRGASADAPENTLPAFREAIAQGADGVELDTMLCNSGEVVVCHDERLDRLAGVDRWVRSMSLAELQRLDVGSRLGFGPASIPQLEEVVEALPATAWLNIELKCSDSDDGGLSRKVAGYLAQRGLVERVIVSSFNAGCLVRAGRAQPKLHRGLLIDPDRSFWVQNALVRPRVSNYSVHPHHSACTAQRVRRWKAAGLRIAAWTVDDPAEASRLEQLGVDCCITNRPGLIRRGLQGAAG